MNKKPFAVFDIDGTLIRWQLYHAVVDELAKADHISPATYDIIRKQRMAWKNRKHQESFKEYERAIVHAYEEALPTLDPETFDALAEKVAHKYRKQVYTYTRDLIKTLKQDDYILLAISGSHKELIDYVAPIYGFDDWVGSTYHRDEGVFTGEKYIAAHYKAEILRDLIKKHNLTREESYGVGDSFSDSAFLKLVDHPIAFNPNRELLDIAIKHNWKIVLERKNVVYELDNISTTPAVTII
ncbi:HAD-IB family hydrolase [soil metagenome]